MLSLWLLVLTTTTCCLAAMSSFERAALVDLYTSTNGDAWTVPTGAAPWAVNASEQDACGWWGIICTGGSGGAGSVVYVGACCHHTKRARVDCIDSCIALRLMIRVCIAHGVRWVAAACRSGVTLSSSHLVGTLPTTLGSLTALRYVWRYL